jgi:hypothetical protein
MKYFKYISLILVLIGCHEKSDIRYTYDTFLSTDNSLLHKNTMTIVKKELSENEYALTIDEKFPYKNHDTTFCHAEFFEKYANQGIYRKTKKNSDYVLYFRHDSLKIFHENNLNSDFLSSKTSSGCKNYKINNQIYTVFSGVESFGNTSVISYYLKDFGYIMFDFKTKEYMKLVSVSRYSKRINKKILCTIIDSLEHDYEFCSIYIFSPKNKKYQQWTHYIDSLAKTTKRRW